jgi:predicted phosphodiesterase
MNELPKPKSAGQTVLKRELAAKIVDRFPDSPNRSIARVLRAENPDAFPSLENARAVVRSLRGSMGVDHRERNSPVKRTKPLGWQQAVIPPTASKKRTPLVLTGPMKLGVFSDLHIPYHNPQAVEVAIGHMKKAKCDTLLINGDLGDFYACSRHEKDPRRRLSEELDAIRQFLFWLRSQFPKQRILYKIGNHETNLERYLMREAPVLLGVPDFTIRDVLKLDSFNIEVVESLQLIQAGKLSIYHGHELPQGMSSPVNPARGLWMRVQETILCGHWHRTSEHTETTGISRKVSSCWSVGCLCDLSPDYAIVNRWNHGFAIVDIDKDGSFEVHNHKIIDGRVY